MYLTHYVYIGSFRFGKSILYKNKYFFQLYVSVRNFQIIFLIKNLHLFAMTLKCTAFTQLIFVCLQQFETNTIIFTTKI